MQINDMSTIGGVLVVAMILLVVLMNIFSEEAFLLLPPYWNIPTRHTRGMSYDIRGDPPIGYSYVGPWNISSWAPSWYNSRGPYRWWY